MADGDNRKAAAILADMSAGRGGGDGDGGRAGHESYEYAGYINMGAPRPPFSWVCEDPEEGPKNEAKARKQAERWLALCEKYRPEVEAKRAVGV